MVNVLFICHMLQARVVCKILEYKPSLKFREDWEVTDHQQKDRLRIMYTWEKVLPTRGLKCGVLKKFGEVDCQYVAIWK